MAIVDMQKLSVSAERKHRKAILETLQAMGVMQIENNAIDDPELEKMDTRTAVTTFEKNADTLSDALKLLYQYSGKKKPGGLFSEKKEIDKAVYEKAIQNQTAHMRKAQSIVQIEKSIEEAKARIHRDEDRITALAPWMKLDIPMNLRGTKTTRALIGTMPGILTEADVIEAASKDMTFPVPLEVTILTAEANITYVVVICLHRQRDQVLENLRSAGFARPTQVEEGVPSEVAENLQKDIEAQNLQIEKLQNRIASMADATDDFEITSDYYRTRAEKYRLLSTIPQSKHIFFLEGWVTKENAEPLQKMLEDKFGALVELEEIREGELEPTLLRNKPFARNAEGILESYGLPTHGRADPTFVMSIFYVIFFGMMLSDAGYGILMAVGCAVILKKKPRLEESLKKMLQLFFWCGISTTFWGFMYGGFFGDVIDVVAKTFFGYPAELTPILKPLWFAPLDDPMRLLIWCMLFGLIHLFAGLAIKGYEYLKNKDVVGFLSDVVAWYFFITGLVLMLIPSDIFASISGTHYVFPDVVNTIAKIITLIGLVTILLMSGRANKNWGLRIALGAYDIYGVMNWLSDVLSYSRLLALGLATGVIASVINMMASIAGGGFFGAIIFIIVFLAGHTLNIGINALGAYVHTNRLQYVEFFGKFYDGGGRPFKPFKMINQYVEIKEEKQS